VVHVACVLLGPADQAPLVELGRLEPAVATYDLHRSSVVPGCRHPVEGIVAVGRKTSTRLQPKIYVASVGSLVTGCHRFWRDGRRAAKQAAAERRAVPTPEGTMSSSKHLEGGTDLLVPAEHRPEAGAATAGVSEDRDAGPAARSKAGLRRKRRLVVGTAGLALALGLGGFTVLMRSNASFAEENVARQLSEQQISFKPAEALTPEERQRPCLVKYAGQQLTTGMQSQCYANQFIGVHLKAVAGGKTFSQMKAIQDGLRAQLGEAQARNDPSVADLQRQLGEVTGKRQTLFEGETVRGLLMTSYAFGVLGSKAAQAADVASWTAMAVLALSLTILVGTAVKGRAGR